jgi:protein O-GlcNAc transferase
VIDTRNPTPAHMMRQAEAAYQRRDWAEATRWCLLTLRAQPDDFDALNMAGVIALQLQRSEEAAHYLEHAVRTRSNEATAHNNYGIALMRLKRVEDARQSYERALAIAPDAAESWFNHGNALKELGRFDAARASYDRALAIKPDYAEAHNNRGLALQALDRPEEALESYGRALAFKPQHAGAHLNRGRVLHSLNRIGEALEAHGRAIELQPNFAEAHHHRGDALLKVKRYQEALASHEAALRIKPDYAEAYNSCGAALQALKRFDDALACFETALKLQPDFAEANFNRGVALMSLNRSADALPCFRRALEIRPQYANAYHNLGVALGFLLRPEEALECFERALEIQPDFEWLRGVELLTRMKLNDWRNLPREIEALSAQILAGARVSSPWPVVTLVDSPALQQRAAAIWVAAQMPADGLLGPIAKRPPSRKIRLGYYSADFHGHATAYLIAELFERHDKDKFELVAFSFGPDFRDEMRQRLTRAFDEFLEVRTKSDRDIALLSRELGIDIAVDLKGFTRHERHAVFAYRAAPVQVNYLGYPGTVGAPYMDYLIADHQLIPEGSRNSYTEKIVYLPDSYQVNDRRRLVSERHFSREELGLPPTGFVFCCFNASFKIAPPTFDAWMRILERVDGSVLWLLEDGPAATRNLRTEAEARGVDGSRLLFAAQIPQADHLARYRAVDLFLDTLPCNAHTTASDALWVGCPVLTQAGESFAARVAASLLTAIDLPELIAVTAADYEQRAIAIATQPGLLAQIKNELAAHRLTTALFDTDRYTRHLETAYARIYARHLDGLAPEHIFVPA